MFCRTQVEENASVLSAAPAARIDNVPRTWKWTKCGPSTKLALLPPLPVSFQASHRRLRTGLAEMRVDFFVAIHLLNEVDRRFIMMAFDAKRHRWIVIWPTV